MAKDGTQRGGPRRGTGPKPKAVPAIAIGDLTAECELPDPYDLDGDDMPQVEVYMKDPQKDGSTLMAERIFRNTWLWLKKYGCEKLVSTQVIESYAMSYARTVQCERALSSYGFLAKHPTTGNAIQSPYVAMLVEFRKQMSQSWYQIYQVVKDNMGANASGNMNDPMERLLSGKR